MRTVVSCVDLAKLVFSVCAVDAAGRARDRREFRRDAFIPWSPGVPAGTAVAIQPRRRIGALLMMG